MQTEMYEFLAAQFDTEDHRHYDTLYDGFREECEELIAGSEDKDNFIDEVGDVLWYLATLCKHKGTTLDEAMNKNILKLEHRLLNGK